MQQDFVSNNAIVIDNGSSVIRAGFSNEDRPSCEFRSYIGFNKYDKVLESSYTARNNVYFTLCSDLQTRWIGDELNNRRGLCALKYPIQHGIIENWDEMRLLWQQVFSNLQLGNRVEEHPVRTLCF